MKDIYNRQMKLVGVALYADEQFVRFITVDKDGIFDEPFDTGIHTYTVYALYSLADEAVYLPPHTQIHQVKYVQPSESGIFPTSVKER